MATEVAETMPARLRKVAAAVTDTGTAHKLALKQRRELILEAIDTEGMHQREVANLLGLAQSRITAILATPGDDDD